MAVSTGPSIRAAVRVINQNSCGSGSICGRNADGSYILTNAHVAGTKIGRVVQVDVMVDGATRRISAKVIMASYSDKTLADWALLFAEGFTEIEPVKLSKKRPSGSHYTMGCPRCVWPPKNTDITTHDVDDDSPLWRWNPNSIGGQSGSGVYDDEDGFQYGLLTWSWGGYGAGQMTAEIYRQATQRTTAGAPRIEGLMIPNLAPLPPGEEGDVGSDPELEEGFFAQVSIGDVDIWAEDDPPPPDPQQPDDTRKLIVQFLMDVQEFAKKWEDRFKTLKEKTGPGAAKPGSNYGL